MWHLVCLTAVSLIAASHQRAPPVFANRNNTGEDSGTISPSASADNYAKKWQNVGNIYKFTDLQPASTPAVQNDTCPPCTCGALGKKLGIVGGNLTYVNEYPWMVMLLLNNSKFFCGGSLINDRYVMTAAHCVRRVQANEVTIRLLEYDQSTTTDSESKDYNISEVIVHEEYDPHNFSNDIALLHLATKLIFSPKSKIHPVCLPEKGESFVGYRSIVTGWGYTSEYHEPGPGPISNVLKEAIVPIVSNEECNKFYNELNFTITDNMICDGYEDGGEDSCQGDSGGPLHIIKNNASYHVVGIVSWSIGCALPELYGVNTRVSKYLDWLAEKTKDACPCNNAYDSSKNHK